MSSRFLSRDSWRGRSPSQLSRKEIESEYTKSTSRKSSRDRLTRALILTDFGLITKNLGDVSQSQVVYTKSTSRLKLYLNPLHRNFENAKKRPSFCEQGHTGTLLTINHRIDSDYCGQSENGIRDRTLVDLY